MRRSIFSITAAGIPAAGIIAAMLGAPSAARAEQPAQAVDESRWCAPELEQLAAGVCYFAPEPKSDASQGPDTVVLFLHGVIQHGTTWQWNQQRAIARAAKVNGFVALMPRGRRGIGPKGMKDWWTWPTASKYQKSVEPELFTEWGAALVAAQQKRGAPFTDVFVFGFSNGAYYGSSLALRDAFAPATGYGIFAGGGSTWLEQRARAVKDREPVYIGYGTKDPAAKKDGYRLGAMLRKIGWPYEMVPRKGVGHTMTDAQLAETVKYLREKSAAASGSAERGSAKR